MASKISLGKLARAVQGECLGDENMAVTGINSLDEAGPFEISFFSDRRYSKSLEETKAGALLVDRRNDLFKGPQILTSHVELAYAKIAAMFVSPLTPCGISDKAVIGTHCRLGENISIFPLVYVGEGSQIDEGTVLFPGVFVGDNVMIGKRTVLHPNVTIQSGCIIGNDVIIHAGTTIGSDGFGFVRDREQSVKVPQVGIVQIDDHVEIGSNNCVDRAAFGRTWIKRGVKTDNLVQIAHNVVIGDNSIIVAQAGISGSSRLGRGVVIGGQVGVIDHATIGDGAMIGPQAGVSKPIPKGGIMSGSPALPHRDWLKSTATIPKLPKMNERLRALEKKVEELSGLLLSKS